MKEEIDYTGLTAKEEFDIYIKKKTLINAFCTLIWSCISGVFAIIFDFLVLIIKAPFLLAIPGELRLHWQRLDTDVFFRKTFVEMAFNELRIKVVYIFTSKINF